MRTVAATRQDVLPAGQTHEGFIEAELAARTAAKEFAAIKAEHGTKAAMELFNRQVSFWANHFTNVRYRRWVYVLGECMDGETHEFTIPMDKLIRKYRKTFPGQSISTTTIQKYNKLLGGVIYDVQHNVQGPDDENPGAYKSNTYTMHFHRVLAADQVVPHDFTQVSPGARLAESDISHSRTKSVNGSVNGGGDGCGDGSVNGGGDIRLTSTSSPHSSPTSSSSRADGEAAASLEETKDRDESITRSSSTRPGTTGVSFLDWDENDTRLFFQIVSGILRVPESAIGRKSILDRMKEVEQDFPGFDWFRLMNFQGFRTRVPVGNPVGLFRESLDQIVQGILDADAAKERAVREEAERQEADRLAQEAREAKERAKEEARIADEKRLAEVILEMRGILDEYVAAYLYLTPRAVEGRVRFSITRDIETVRSLYAAEQRLCMMKREIDKHARLVAQTDQ